MVTLGPWGGVKFQVEDATSRFSGVNFQVEHNDTGGNSPPVFQVAVGRFEIHGLAAGLGYHLRTQPWDGESREIIHDLRVEPGQTLDLGMIRGAPAP